MGAVDETLDEALTGRGGGAGFGLVTTVQAVPFHCSVRVTGGSKLLPVDCAPTATTVRRRSCTRLLSSARVPVELLFDDVERDCVHRAADVSALASRWPEPYA